MIESDRWSLEENRAYQDRKLAELLDRAIRNVPFYCRYRHLLGRPARQIFLAIEPIEKKDVQADPRSFLDPTVNRDSTYTTSTGGTSGQPLAIILDKEGFQIEWAFMVAQWMRAGYKPGMKKATFRGVPFPGGRLWQENPVYDEMQFSPFAMNQENLRLYVEKLKAFQPDFLYGYPSALTLLGHHLASHPDLEIPKVKALLCGSENVREGQRDFLEKVFGTRFYSWYGMSEKVILAGECEKDSSYHAFPQYGITEILDRNGNLTSASGSEGELVGTGFMNTAMPLIRYRLGDRSRIVGDRCERCGRAHLLLGTVEGRWVQEMIVGKSGALISLTALNMHGEVFKDVLRFQFHQRKRGEAVLRLVPAKGYTEESSHRILASLKGKTGPEVDWSLDARDSIELSPRGKGVFLIQEMKVPGWDPGQEEHDQRGFR